MAIGERIRFIRNLHGATQKWLGLKLGFSEKTAETRVGQYEIGARTPKDEMIKDIAEIFDVSPQAIKLPDLDNYIAVLHTLFAIEDIYGLTINMLDDEFCLTLDRENSSYFTMYDMLRAWNKVARKYRNGEMTKEEYDNWRYNYPKFDTPAELKYLAGKNGKIAEAFEYARAITRIQEFPNAEVEEAKWVSVEEKPLKNGVDEAILLYVQTDGCKPYITTGYFYSDKFLNNGMCEQDGVTHWRPLPSPPKT